MPEWLTSFLKLTPLPLFVIAAGSGVLLFAPKWFVQQLGLEPFSTSYAAWTGVAFLVSALFLIGHFLTFAWKRGTALGLNRFEKRREEKRLRARMAKLTPMEMELLQDFKRSGERGQTLADGSDTSSLIAAGVLVRDKEAFNDNGFFVFLLTDTAYKLLSDMDFCKQIGMLEKKGKD